MHWTGNEKIAAAAAAVVVSWFCFSQAVPSVKQRALICSLKLHTTVGLFKNML